jgi:hypothetical protein
MHHVENRFPGGGTVRDVVMSMLDGLTVPFPLAARISGPLPRRISS